jgi:hypothetical protein
MLKLAAAFLLISRILFAQVELPAAEALAKATVDGKYRTLLKQIKVADDVAVYGELNDWGAWTGTTWGGHADLPAGYWVYVYPCWYIWSEQVKETPLPPPVPIIIPTVREVPWYRVVALEIEVARLRAELEILKKRIAEKK